MKIHFFVLLMTLLLIGCAHADVNPTTPSIPADVQAALAGQVLQSEPIDDGPYRLWGEWTFYFSGDHNSVEVVPRRAARLHLNALKFLEEYCTDCLQITQIKNNGDETIDLTVRINHPFNGFPQYTGFDVKGIIMFNGSYEYPWPSNDIVWPDEIIRLSWRETGDAEVINPDGYTERWSPHYESGSELPIFNYWEGKYASGVPNADLNAYLNFYTNEERHMFTVDGVVYRTYTIYLPPGPVVAGYAVEACWEPPLVTPVTDPLNDFPITANQPEPYLFKWIVNNGEVITDCDECCGPGFGACDERRIELKQWGDISINYIFMAWPEGGSTGMGGIFECESPWEDCYSPFIGLVSCGHGGNGNHRMLSWVLDHNGGDHKDFAYTFVDYTVNDPDLD